jgi:hypothetical protein
MLKNAVVRILSSGICCRAGHPLRGALTALLKLQLLLRDLSRHSQPRDVAGFVTIVTKSFGSHFRIKFIVISTRCRLPGYATTNGHTVGLTTLQRVNLHWLTTVIGSGSVASVAVHHCAGEECILDVPMYDPIETICQTVGFVRSLRVAQFDLDLSLGFKATDEFVEFCRLCEG